MSYTKWGVSFSPLPHWAVWAVGQDHVLISNVSSSLTEALLIVDAEKKRREGERKEILGLKK